MVRVRAVSAKSQELSVSSCRTPDLERGRDRAALYETFAESPVEAIVARLRADLGLAAATLAETVGADSPAWRSSA
jgi:hypothetical protein